MAFAVMKDGKYTGAVYPMLNDAIRKHHTDNGEQFTYIDGRLLNQGTAEEPIWQPEVPDAVPLEVTMRQARLVLHRHGYLTQVPTAIASLDEPIRSEAEIEWEYALTVERSSPIVALLQQALGLTDAQVDDMFREAVTL